MKVIFKFLLYFAFFLFTIFVFVLIYSLCTPISLHNKQIIIYDKNNEIIYQNNQSTSINIEDIDPFILKAIVDIEDKRFYSHMGFDLFRTSNALFKNMKNSDVLEGGSSITQQLAKNVYLSNEQTYERKFQELFYAIRMEIHHSKSDILEGYINSIYYGHGIYGLQNASQFYFQKNVNDLTLAEVSLLIGIPNGPSYYSPYVSIENATEKRNQILQLLMEDGLISNKKFEEATNESIQLYEQDYIKSANKNYYIDAVLQKVEAMKLEESELSIYTYYDDDSQNALTTSINTSMQGKEMQSSGIIIEPYTFNISALQGGNDFNESNYNRAIYSNRQIASTIKPLLYYLALNQGFTPSSTFSSEPTTFTLDDGSTYAPENYNKAYPNKDISMIHAVSMSDNIYAVKTHLFLGMNSLVSALNAFGIKADNNPSLALGCVNLSIYDITKIYATFASEGQYLEPSFISKITDNHKPLYERDMNTKQLLDRDTTLVLNQLLTATYDAKNTDQSYPTMLGKQSEVKSGIKSGTSDWDTWVLGFNPYYTVGIWNGYDDNREITKKEYEVSKNIWKDCFNLLMSDKEEVWYEKSDHIIEKKVNPINGEVNDTGSPYWYLK